MKFSLKKAWTVAWKDYKTYFTSPIAYIMIAGFLAIMGWMFFFSLSHFSMQALQYKQFGMGKSVSITDGIVRLLECLHVADGTSRGSHRGPVRAR